MTKLKLRDAKVCFDAHYAIKVRISPFSLSGQLLISKEAETLCMTFDMSKYTHLPSYVLRLYVFILKFTIFFKLAYLSFVFRALRRCLNGF